MNKKNCEPCYDNILVKHIIKEKITIPKPTTEKASLDAFSVGRSMGTLFKEVKVFGKCFDILQYVMEIMV